MTRHVYILLLLLGVFPCTRAQEIAKKEETLLSAFNKADSDTAKFNKGLDLSHFYRNQDSARSMQWYRTSKLFIRNRESEARLLNELGSFLIVYGKMDSANIILNQALAIAGELKSDKIKAAIYNNLGVSSLQLSQNKEALSYQLKALKIREALNDEEGTEASLMNIGNIYWSIYSLDTALSYFQRALDYALRLDLNGEIAKAYNNMASVYFDRDAFDSSYQLMQKAMVYRNKSNSLTGTCITLTALGDISSMLKRFSEAIGYYNRAFALSEQLGDNMNMANILNSLGHMEQGRKNYDKSIGYQLKALELSRRIPYPQVEKDALIELAENYERSSRPGKALEYYKLYTAARDSISKKSNEVEIAELNTKYQTEKKEQRIALLSKENTIQKLSISRRNSTIGLIASLFFAAGALGLFLYKRYKLKHSVRLQQEIIRQQDLSVKAVLEAEERERKRIAGDLHDGVGQMFSTVKMNLSGLEGQVTFTDNVAAMNFSKTLALVDESCKEVRSLSHQMAPNMLLTSGLVAAVRDFLGKIDERRLKISLDVDGLHERLNGNVETVLYRVIQETVNNVIKHARASRLDIQLVKDKDGLSVMLEDNGEGFSYQPDGEMEGIGLKNMISRITFLKGTIDIDAAPGRGTVVSLWIPLD